MTIRKKYRRSSEEEDEEEDEDLNSLDGENDDEIEDDGSVQEKEDDWPIIPPEVQVLIDEAFDVQRILNGVLSHLTFPDLLECRLVDTKWEKKSTTLLTARNSAQVSIEFYWLEEELNTKKANCLSSFRHPPERWKIGFIGKKGLVRTVTQYLGSRVKPPDIPYEMEKFSLRALSTILQNNPTNFPCSSFTLWDADLGNAEIQRFFQIQGSQIQSLRLCSANPDSPFTKVPLPKSKNGLTLDLPILKYLTWTDWDKKSVLRVMRAASNLTVTAFQDDSVNYLDTILSVKKVDTVKRLKVSTVMDTINLPNYSENVKLFAKAGPQLQTLEFGTRGSTPVQNLVGPDLKLCNKLKAACIALLEASKDFIENLSLGQLCAYFDLKSLPKFRNLKKLSLAIVEGQEGMSSALFPPRIDLRDSFPRLQCLELRAKDFNDDEDLQPDLFWDTHFPPSEPFRGDFALVKTLEMDVALCTDVWLHKIYKILCPNFTTLVLHNCTKNKLEKSLPKIFEMWTHLQVLKLHFGIGEDLPSLDEEFTGFSKEFFVQGPLPLPLPLSTQPLEGLGHSNGIDKIDADKKVNEHGRPSVCDLKELKTIEIWTTGQAFFADDLPLTQTSLQYISKMMPDLKVGLHIRKNSTAVDHNHFLFG